MKVVAIIQARMGSSRLPGKVMMKIQGKTVLEHVIRRVKQSKRISDIVIATTIEPDDDAIIEEMKRLNVKHFRGSEDDVLSRYYYAAKENDVDVIIRITSDCPLIDPIVIDKMISAYLESSCDLLTNAGLNTKERTFPRGLDASIFSFESLEEAFKNATEKYQREHVTPYIYQNKLIEYYKNKINYSKYRWTLDTDEDFKLISEVYQRLYKGTHDFYMDDIIRMFESDPKLIDVNKHIEQKKIN